MPGTFGLLCGFLLYVSFDINITPKSYYANGIIAKLEPPLENQQSCTREENILQECGTMTMKVLTLCPLWQYVIRQMGFIDDIMIAQGTDYVNNLVGQLY